MKTVWPFKLLIGLWAISLQWCSVDAKLVEYEWNVTYTNIDIDGRTLFLQLCPVFKRDSDDFSFEILNN